MSHATFTEFVSQLRANDNDAATQLFQRFNSRLLAIAHRRLDKRLRRYVDPEDVVQSAYLSFFQGLYAGEFTLHHGGGLWALLRTIVVRKCIRQAAIYFSERRDVKREVAAQAADSVTSAACKSPYELLAVGDLIDRVQRRMDPRQQQVLRMRLYGSTVCEISQYLGCSERTVFRVLSEIAASAPAFPFERRMLV